MAAIEHASGWPWFRLAAVACAFILTSAISLSQTPYGEKFGFSDHYAHMNAARLFPRIGKELWRTPIDLLFRDAVEADLRGAPADVRSADGLHVVPGWPLEKPFAGGWTNVGRPYPPGDLLIVGPIAAAYHFTNLSFTAACHALILVFLGLAHIAFYIVWRGSPKRGGALYAVAALVAYAYVMFWTLRGFYDAAAMIPLLLCAERLHRRDWLGAIVAFVAAFSIHFRALFFVPWVLSAAFGIWSERSWSSWRAREWLTLMATAVAAAGSLYTLVLVTPSLGALPLENPIHPGHIKCVPVIAMATAAVVALTLFIRVRAILDIFLLAWISLILVSVRQVQAWHAFLLFPWVFAPASFPLARIGRVALVVTVTGAVFL